MPNNVFLNDAGFEEIVFEGLQTKDSMMETLQESLKYDAILSAQGKPVKTLINITNLTDLDFDATLVAGRAVKGIMYDKVALYGGIPEVKAKVEGILKEFGKEDSIKSFDTREEAIKFLGI